MTLVRSEIQSAVLRQAAPADESDEVVGIPPHAWALPAAVGALLGSLALSPLTWLWLENRQLGLLVGGAGGAFALIRGLAYLAVRPQLQAVLQKATAVAGTGLLAGGLWRAARGQSTGWARGALYLAGAWLLLAAVRPRRASAALPESIAQSRPRVERQLCDGANWILAFAWSHPDRLQPPEKGSGEAAPQCAGFVYNALTDLHTELDAGRDGETLRETVRELFQRLQEDGYAWDSVPRGAAFDEAMKEAFDTIGRIQSGQSVRMRRAALRHWGRVIHKGELRRE
jgi:hypothetical protein